MIKKLQIKLIIASMLSLLIVLSVILGAVGILNYKGLVADADRVLMILSENDGNFPLPQDSPEKSEQYNKQDSMLPFDKNKEGRFSPELPYESRYFTVFLSDENAVISVNTGKIAAINTSEAIDYARKVIEGGNSEGFTGNYRYKVYCVDNEFHIIFLDCGRELSSFKTFIINSVCVCAVGLLAVLCLLLFLSARIVKPFSENYEKQKRFITDAGHELKTPLTIIDADAEVLEMDYGENEWLEDIKNQTKRLADLTNDLIFLARMEENQPETEMIEFSLSDIVDETVETFLSLAVTGDKNLMKNIQPMISLCGDEKAVRQLVNILLDNAMKYSDREGDICVTLDKKKNVIRLCVFNTVPYVSKESIVHFFDRFYRADQSRNSQTGGYGLGLAIACAIVNAHKGKITAQTQDEKSLLITVIFPGKK